MTYAKPRMGRIEYLNVLPVYYPLETGTTPHGYELVYGKPAELNALAERGELEVSSTSSIEYARRPEQYWIVPDMGICSNGKVLSVLLLSRRPVAEMEGAAVLVSPATHTSAALLKLLLKDYAGVSVTFHTGEISQAMQQPEAPEAMLAIGDEALRLRNYPAYPYIWDLGEEWRAWTGLPFTFGLWVVNREAVKRAALHEDPAKTLHAGRDWSAAHRDAIVEAAAKRYPMTPQALNEYFDCLYYSLGEREQQGLRLFYKRLAEAGEIPKAPELVFWPGA